MGKKQSKQTDSIVEINLIGEANIEMSAVFNVGTDDQCNRSWVANPSLETLWNTLLLDSRVQTADVININSRLSDDRGSVIACKLQANLDAEINYDGIEHEPSDDDDVIEGDNSQPTKE